MTYKKSDLERHVLIQLENLNAQGEHIDLLKEQNELLAKYNHKLIDELSDELKEPKPYPIPKRKKTMNSKEIIISLIVEEMRFNQRLSALGKLDVEVYFDLDLMNIVANLMGISQENMTDSWMEL